MIDHQYENLLYKVLTRGALRKNRTGTDAYSLFGERLEYDLREGFPLITTKRVNFHAIQTELRWFLKGKTNIRWLRKRGVKIWDEWADEDGNLGPVYGSQWRSWPSSKKGDAPHDQIRTLIDQLKHDPRSRRMVVSAWNVGQLSGMALAPRHALFQVYVTGDGRLDLQVYQRSADVFLGLPYNIASYALLTHMLADQVGLRPGRLIWLGGDVHLYENHREQAEIQVHRLPSKFPTLKLRRAGGIDRYKDSDITFGTYLCHPRLPGKVAV